MIYHNNNESNKKKRKNGQALLLVRFHPCTQPFSNRYTKAKKVIVSFYVVHTAAMCIFSLHLAPV